MRPAARTSDPQDGVRYVPANMPPPPHEVAVFAFDGIASFELGVAVEVFALPRPELDVAWWYGFAVCAERPGRLRAVGGFGLDVAHGLDTLAAADTVIVPGVPDPRADPPPALLDALRAAHARGARIVSICSGAFALAAAGLLDGREATTHWQYAGLLAARHRVARRMVVSPHRTGDQAQFVEAPMPARPGGDAISTVMSWALERLGERIEVADLARAAHLSPRTLTRRFAAATGTSPARWLLEQRIAAAVALLEAGDTPVEEVGALVGLPGPAAFRRHFARVMGVPPSVYRRTFAAAA